MIITRTSQMDKTQPQYIHGGRKEWLWVCARLALGLLQMFGAVFSVTLLVRTGVTPLALIGVAITGIFTTVSVLLFGARRSKRAGS